MKAPLLLALLLCGCAGAAHGPADAGDAGPADAGPGDAGPGDGGVPAWLAAAAVDQWVEIPGTAGAGGAPANAYSGLAIKESTSELVIAAAGGHSDSADNRTVSIRLDVDAPAWVLRKAASPVAGHDVGYNADGQPASMHTYQCTHYSKTADRVMRVRPRFTYPSANDANTNDGFNLETNSWDGQGVHPLAVRGYGFVRDGDGQIWTNAFERYDPLARSWSSPITTLTSDVVRFPGAYDSRRRQIFTLQWGDGQGYDSGLSASRVPVDGHAQLHVDFVDNAALAQLKADQPAYAGMDYDPLRDEFLFYSAASIASGSYQQTPGRVYAITPSDTGSWTVALKTVTGTPAATGTSGVQNRFRYLPALKGFVLLPTASANLWFLRTQ
jgi:hypothetical protein